MTTPTLFQPNPPCYVCGDPWDENCWDLLGPDLYRMPGTRMYYSKAEATQHALDLGYAPQDTQIMEIDP